MTCRMITEDCWPCQHLGFPCLLSFCLLHRWPHQLVTMQNTEGDCSVTGAVMLLSTGKHTHKLAFLQGNALSNSPAGWNHSAENIYLIYDRGEDRRNRVQHPLFNSQEQGSWPGLSFLKLPPSLSTERAYGHMTWTNGHARAHVHAHAHTRARTCTHMHTHSTLPLSLFLSLSL